MHRFVSDITSEIKTHGCIEMKPMLLLLFHYYSITYRFVLLTSSDKTGAHKGDGFTPAHWCEEEN